MSTSTTKTTPRGAMKPKIAINKTKISLSRDQVCRYLLTKNSLHSKGFVYKSRDKTHTSTLTVLPQSFMDYECLQQHLPLINLTPGGTGAFHTHGYLPVKAPFLDSLESRNNNKTIVPKPMGKTKTIHVVLPENASKNVTTRSSAAGGATKIAKIDDKTIVALAEYLSKEQSNEFVVYVDIDVTFEPIYTALAPHLTKSIKIYHMAICSKEEFDDVVLLGKVD